MKRSLQEYVELVVFGLVALLVGTGLLWLVGWVFSLGGVALKWVAGLLWNLLRFIVPVAIAGGLVYFLVKAAQDRQAKPATASASGGAVPTGTTPPGGPVVSGNAVPQGTGAAAEYGSGDSGVARPPAPADTADGPVVTSPADVGTGAPAPNVTPQVDPDLTAAEVPDDPTGEDDRG